MIPPQLLSQTSSVPLYQLRPYPQFSGNTASVTSNADTNSISDYNGLVLKSERRFKNGYSWIATFAWSKWIDNASGQGEPPAFANAPAIGTTVASYQNIYNRTAERSLSDWDVPWRMVLSPIYELPFGKDRRWMNRGGVLNAALGGWEWSTMATIQSGVPMSPTVLSGGLNYLGDQNQTLRPNYLTGCNPAANRWQAGPTLNSVQYLNPACFGIPAYQTYGTQSRTLPNIMSPGVRQFNMMLSKNFYYKERYRLQLRWQVVDVFNTPQFLMPQLGFSQNSGTFGIMNTCSFGVGPDGVTQRLMFLAAKLYF
jgi:hypothetical protein